MGCRVVFTSLLTMLWTGVAEAQHLNIERLAGNVSSSRMQLDPIAKFPSELTSLPSSNDLDPRVRSDSRFATRLDLSRSQTENWLIVMVLGGGFAFGCVVTLISLNRRSSTTPVRIF